MTDEERIKLAKMEQKLQDVSEAQDKIYQEMKDGFARLEQKFDNHTADLAVSFGRELEKKAGRWVEKVLWGLGAVVGTSVVLALLDKILLK